MKKNPKYTTENHQFKNLEKFQSIDVEGDWNKVKNRIQFEKKRRISTLLKVAAITVILLSIGLIMKQYLFGPQEMIMAMTVEGHKEVLLPDGSLVYLNQHSRLTYPEKFRKNSRRVSLSGEGFFQVAHNPARPFNVNVAGLANVEVLGTSFNIQTIKEEEAVKIQVVDGKVAFFAKGKDDSGKILEKDDQAELQDGIIVMNTEAELNFLSWKTGIIYFEQEKIEDVTDLLERHYKLNIELDGSVSRELTFTSVIDNQEIEAVLEEISLVLGISYTFQDDQVKIFMSE